MTKSTHVHKFKRLRYKSGNEVFFCALPDCSFKINPALVLGKKSICWRCGETFLMDEYSLRLAKPHCSECHRPKGLQQSIEEIIPTHNQTAETELWDKPLTLSERLNQITKAAQQEEEEI